MACGEDEADAGVNELPRASRDRGEKSSFGAVKPVGTELAVGILERMLDDSSNEPWLGALRNLIGNPSVAVTCEGAVDLGVGGKGGDLKLCRGSPSGPVEVGPEK